MIYPEALDVGYRINDEGKEEFFVLDCEGNEVANFSDMGGPWLGSNAELAALDFARRTGGRQPNWLPSLRKYSDEKTEAVTRLAFGK